MVGRYVVASSVQKLIPMESNRVIDGNHLRNVGGKKFMAFAYKPIVANK